MDVGSPQRRLHAFADERDWDRHHTPKNPATANASEAGELVDVFQWPTEEESHHLSEADTDALLYVAAWVGVLGR